MHNSIEHSEQGRQQQQQQLAEPDWLADLSEEWVAQQGSPASSTSSRHSLVMDAQTMDFGSIVVKDSLPKQDSFLEQGTTVINNATTSMASHSPAKHRQQGGTRPFQLALAASALAGKSDLLADQRLSSKPATQLQALFREQSEISYGVQDEAERLQERFGECNEPAEAVIFENNTISGSNEGPDEFAPQPESHSMRDAGRAGSPTPSVTIQQAHVLDLPAVPLTSTPPMEESQSILPPTRDFDFVPPVSAIQKAPVTPQLPVQSEDISTSTPAPVVANENRAPASPSLGLFKITQHHLQALVDEIGQYKSPPRVYQEGKEAEVVKSDEAWLQGFKEFVTQVPLSHGFSASDGDHGGDAMRSAKRVRLSASELRLVARPSNHESYKSTQSPSTARHPDIRRPYGRRQAALSTPPRPPLRLLPPLTNGAKSSYLQGPHTSKASPQWVLSPAIANETPAIAVRHKLAEARAMMERLKARPSHRDKGVYFGIPATTRPAMTEPSARQHLEPDLSDVPARQTMLQDADILEGASEINQTPGSAETDRERDDFLAPLPRFQKTVEGQLTSSSTTASSLTHVAPKNAHSHCITGAPHHASTRFPSSLSFTSSDQQHKSSTSHVATISTAPTSPRSCGAEPHPDRYSKTSGTVSRETNVMTSQRTGGLSAQIVPQEASSLQSTPTAVFAQPSHYPARLRSMSIAPSNNSTFAWHKKTLNANATMLTECSFGISHAILINVLTDVAPVESHWKEITEIDLEDKRLDSIVRLKEILPRLLSANLSRNQLSYLTGMPTCLRYLHLKQNNLSDLTSFSHLCNLEELDISGNADIKRLQNLSGLSHLRCFHADNCSIVDVNGITGLDSLRKVSLRGNLLTSLSLTSTSWHKLEFLDLAHNRLEHIEGVDSLRNIRILELDNNTLRRLDFGQELSTLRILKICHNQLSFLDVASLPNLRTLFVDHNYLEAVRSLSKLENLENLSCRSQHVRGMSIALQEIRDVKRIYLANNPLPLAFADEALFNLTLLELRGCQLQSLPSDFATILPNCRIAILDDNFLEDISPLFGMKRLKHLSLQGGQLKKTRHILEILAGIPQLEFLDLRSNPLTMGLYPSSHTSDTRNKDDFAAADRHHRRALPNEWRARRKVYRALLIEASSKLTILDGLRVNSNHRSSAQKLVEHFSGLNLH